MSAREVLLYNYPHIRHIEIDDNVQAQIIDYINNNTIELRKGLKSSSFVRCCNANLIFSYYELLPYEDESLIWKQVYDYIDFLEGSPIVLFNIEKEKPKSKDDFADYKFSNEASKIIKEIQKQIVKLQQVGVADAIIKQLLIKNIEPQLSKVVITKEYRILLPDYNKEIKMSPLPKAVFLLFLKHPDGILFKHLRDYRKELGDIYKTISNRESLKGMSKSISEITDPTKNSINEKCSRIREAFVSEFDVSLAQNYFVTGGRGEPKKILIDRRLVTWEI